MTSVSPDKDERRCSTCGATDPQENEFCSNGFHAPGETYWPTPDKDEVELEVTQSDREAAAAIAEWQTGMGLGPPFFHPLFANGVREGAWDNHPLVQAFAQQRLAAMSPVDRLREALGDAQQFICEKFCGCSPDDREHIEKCDEIRAALSSPEPVGEGQPTSLADRRREKSAANWR